MKKKREGVVPPDSPEKLLLLLESLPAQQRKPFLIAGRERFRGNLFNAFLNQSRVRLNQGLVEQAGELLQMAAWVGRYGVNELAQGKCFFAIGSLWHDFSFIQYALPLYRQAVGKFRKADSLSGEARVHAKWGQALVNSQPRVAIRHYHRALRLANAINDQKLTTQVTNNLGNAYLKVEDFRRAWKAFHFALRSAEALGELDLECTARGNLGHTEFELGRYPEAEAILKEAISLSRTLGNDHLETSQTGNLGNVLRALGRLEEAEACYWHALELARHFGDRLYEEIGLGDLGILLFQMGRLNEGITFLEQARAVGEGIGQIGDAARDAYHLTIAYREVGDISAWELAVQECIRLAEAAGDANLQAGILQAQAYQAIALGDWVKAEKFLQYAGELENHHTDTYNACTYPIALGYLAYVQENYVNAEQAWSEAVELAETAGNRFGTLNALMNRASALIMLQRSGEAEKYLHEALKRAQDMNLIDEERLAWEGLGLVMEQQGKFNEAGDCYRQALDLIEVGRQSLEADIHRVGFFAARTGPYTRLVLLLVLSQNKTEAWDICERARSRSLMDALARAEIHIPDSISEALIQSERELLTSLRLRQSELLDANAHQASKLLSELSHLQARLQLIWGEIAQLAPKYAALRHGNTMHFDELRSMLLP